VSNASAKVSPLSVSEVDKSPPFPALNPFKLRLVRISTPQASAGCCHYSASLIAM
jgi:hypothetical protein